MKTLPVVIFSYKISDLLEEVTKRTSYLGKMRGTEQEVHLLDRLSLTSGEDFMFTEFLDNAVTETYEWVKAFGRKVDEYDKILAKYTDMPLNKNFGMSVKDNNGNEYPFDEEIKVDCTYMPNPINNTLQISFAGFRGYNILGEDATIIANMKFRIYMPSMATTIDARVTVPYNALVETKQYTLPFDGNLTNVKNVEMTIEFKAIPNIVTPIKRDTYVEYRTDFNDDTVFEVYKVNFDCDTTNWKDYSSLLAVDPRGCVTLIVERKPHFDKNMISSIDRNLKEAIVNHIIFQWFEYVNAPEAEKFLLKFEDYGQKAKIGLDTHTKDIQRKYKLF